MATLDVSSKKKGHVTLFLEQNKNEFILCNLDYDKIINQQLDLVFDVEEEVSFFLKGDGIVHLSGYVLPDEYDEENQIKSNKLLKENDQNKKTKLIFKGDSAEKKPPTPENDQNKKGEKKSPVRQKKVEQVSDDSDMDDMEKKFEDDHESESSK